MGIYGQRPEKNTLNIFAKLIEGERRHDAPPVGHLIKSMLGESLRIHYYIEGANNSVPALWHRFFVDIREVFPSAIGVRYTGGKKNTSLEDIYWDIKENILPKWGPQVPNGHPKLSVAAYLCAHTCQRIFWSSRSRGRPSLPWKAFCASFQFANALFKQGGE